jgi:hypothetical protein
LFKCRRLSSRTTPIATTNNPIPARTNAVGTPLELEGFSVAAPAVVGPPVAPAEPETACPEPAEELLGAPVLTVG